MSVQILGLKQLQWEIKKTNRELMAAEDPAQMAAGEPIREEWKSRVPVLDSHYRESIIVKWLGKKGAAVAPGWLAELPAEEQPIMYSKRLEFGDSSMPAQPSARPALAASQQRAIEAGAEPFRTVIRGRRGRRIPKA